jgi:hypothetical protein
MANALHDPRQNRVAIIYTERAVDIGRTLQFSDSSMQIFLYNLNEIRKES